MENFDTPPAYNCAGGASMCRHNHLWGSVLIAFGVGILVGNWLEGGFLCNCFAIGIMLVGIAVARR